MSNVTAEVRDLDADLAICEAAGQGSEVSLGFIFEAINGWPYAIRRAQEAEEKIDRLENELRMLQDSGRCFD